LFMVPFRDLRITIEKFSTDIYWLFTNNEVFIYDTLVINLAHFWLLMLKLE
jgi:hypothetical protein